MPAKGLKYTTPYGCVRVHPLANRNTPRAILSESPGGSGARGYTLRVRSRVPSSESKYPPGDSIQITQGLGGYCRGPNTAVPNEVELINIEH